MRSQTTAESGCSFYSRAPDRIFTVEDFSSDEQLMIASAEQFMRKEVLPRTDEVERQEEGLMPQLVAQAGQLGFCGVDTPEAYGGLGLSKCLAARILEFLSLSASFSVTIGVTSGIGQAGLVLFGTNQQRRRYLPHLASGEWIGAYALSEPNSGSDALSLTTRADRDSTGFRLTGTKMWISNAKWAKTFLVMAKVGGEAVTAFLVERDYPGVSISREEHKLGLKGSSTARLVLDEARVPNENLVYLEGKGHHVAFNALNLGRFKLSSMCLGPARDALEHAANYALDRKQFGQPIAKFGLIRQKFVDMAVRFYAAESMIYRTGALIDSAFAHFRSGIAATSEADEWEANRRAAEEFAVECCACKVFASETQGFIADEALQVLGGYGFTEEFPLARIYRDSRVSRIYEGTNEINRVAIASRLTRKLDDGLISPTSARDSFASELASQAVGEVLMGGEAASDSATAQVRMAAVSDLVLLTYAEQSSRLRAAQGHRFGALLHPAVQNWVNVQAAAAFQRATGREVLLPAPAPVDSGELAEAVLERGRPL
jgi:alkylation response protein AidB-like acyl-CoA dehydrogenase